MSDPRPEELIHAEKLLDYGKVDEVLEIVSNFEKEREVTPKEQLWALLLRAEVYGVKLQFKEEIEVGELAYQLSKELGMVVESAEALNYKAQMLFLGKPDEALNLLSQAEELLNSLEKNSYSNLSRINIFILQSKSWCYELIGDFDTALELVLKSLELAEKIESKVWIAYLLNLLGMIHGTKGEHDTHLENAIKSLKLMEELGCKVGIASSLWFLGNAYSAKGNLNSALKVYNESLANQEISKITKANVFFSIGVIYTQMGELDLALESLTQAVQLSDEMSYTTNVINSLTGIGLLYRMKCDYDQAVKYLLRSAMLSQSAHMHLQSIMTYFCLFLVNFENDLNEQALLYLENLREIQEIHDQTHEMSVMTHVYSLAKAMILKKKKRSRDRAEAEKLLIQTVGNTFWLYDLYDIPLVTLCDFLLEELHDSDDPEIIDEITPLIQQLLENAKNRKSFPNLAEGKLLQAKLALIQKDLEGAKLLLTKAQQIAEEHGLKLLAQKISNEHDVLLEKRDEWDKLNNEDAPMAKRIELASFDGVIDRLQGKQAVDPPELVDEEPILLLIMDTSGSTYFNHPFIANWDHSDLFSSFLSAFNTFSDEIFSKSIDRIRIGDNTILINPVEQFLTCYVIKGQSYPALQKLSRFTEAIRENSEIWQALNKSAKTSEMLELNKPPALKTVIEEIFT